MVAAMEIQKGFKKTEVGIIPSDWNDFDITQLIEKANGIKIGPFGSQLKKELLTNAGFRVYGQENVYEKDMETGNRFISREHFKQLNSCELKAGDFIISMMGTIGKCMIVPAKFEAGIMDSHLIRLRLDDSKIKAELLLHFFASHILINQVKKLSVGGIMDGLSSKIVKNISVPLPPTKAEQAAIAEALNDADALITELEKLIAKKKAIKQGAMQELLKPKEGWVEKKLGEECELITKGTTPTSVGRDFQNSGINFIKIESLTENGKIIKDKVAYIDIYTHNLFKRSQLKSGDVLFSIAGALGRVALVNVEILPANTNQALAIIRLKKEAEIDLKYLFYFLNSSKIQKLILAINVQGAQANLSLQNIYDLPVGYPLKSEQTHIAQILSDMDTEIETLEKKLDKYKMLKQGMMQNLLTGRIRLI